MKSASKVFALIALFPLALPACMAPEADSTVDEQDFIPAKEGLAGAGGNPEPPAGTNGDFAPCLWSVATQTELRHLAKSPLDDGTGVLPTIPAIPAVCRHIIASLVQCALSKGDAIRDYDTGDVYEGWWGLAVDWRKDPLDATSSRWVTACMIQKLNAYGVQVPILMEANSPYLKPDASMSAAYPFQESTAFGDMFFSTDRLSTETPAFKAYVCSEDDLITECPAGVGSPWLELRVCDGVVNCGMTFLGKCSDACTDEGGYWKCTDPTGAKWEETVRVDLEGFTGSCK